MFEDTPMDPVLPAADIERAKQWYADKLGLEPVVEDPMLGLEYETGDRRFGLYPSDHAGSNEATAAGFKVDDVEGTAARLRARGVEFEDVEMEGAEAKQGVLTAPTGDQAAWFKDSEGNILAIRSA